MAGGTDENDALAVLGQSEGRQGFSGAGGGDVENQLGVVGGLVE